jgi:hypothetical protein
MAALGAGGHCLLGFRNRTAALIDWLRAYVRIKWDAR